VSGGLRAWVEEPMQLEQLVQMREVGSRQSTSQLLPMGGW